MADDRSVGGGEPLSASVGEQLREKAHQEREAAGEAQASGRQRERVERRKSTERREVLRHTGGERRVRPRRDAGGRRGGGDVAWVGVAGAGAFLAAVGLAREGGLLLVAAGALLVAAGIALRDGSSSDAASLR